ncbi:MAG TPA: hydantoinase B/oxoprolinase family protein, partial [Alphaproteobacteria bacterium]|nr:hydantoinase B/oxoprolinase family protein [Alphaproteobacteria bacterium]
VFGMHLQTASMKKHHPDFREGDAFLDNDPYVGNSHAADHTILVPVFYEGEHFFTVGVKAHQADTGNSQPTTYLAVAKDVYQEGTLIFPCVQVQSDFENIEDIIRMCRRRIRVPDQWYGDYLAAIGAARIGERRLRSFIAKYGAAAVRGFIRDWLDYSERRAAGAIQALPGGRIIAEGVHDPIAPYLPDGVRIQVAIDIDSEDGRIKVDLRDNPDSVDAGLNLTRSTATMSAAQAVFCCLDADIPHNSGSLRRIEVALRENCIVGIPRFPHSCSVATTNMTDTIINAILAGFAQLGDGYGFSQGNMCNGAGTGVCSGKDWRLNDAPYVNQMFMSAGGMPASAHNDGMHGLVNPVSVGLVYRDSIEVNEQRFPFQVQCVRALEDSCGAGRRRGGPASEVIFGPRHDEMLVINICNGLVNVPQGVLGGRPAKAGLQARLAADGGEHVYGTDAYCHLAPGDRLRAVDNGGGGYGDPLERESERVLADVAERYVSRQQAEAVYGVVITGSAARDDLAVDAEATAELRQRLRP